MRLIAGLGNPGLRYAGTRHNVGFMAVEQVARRHNFSVATQKFNGRLREGMIGKHKVLLFEPLTFMNLSGEPLQLVCHFYKILPEEIIVLHDELALAVGRMKIKQGGGHNGHNGLKSIDAHIGKDYWRVRIGIDHPGKPELVTGHVLSDFAKEERPAVTALNDAIAEHIDLLLAGEPDAMMSKVASHTS